MVFQGRCSAVVALFLLLTLQYETARAATFSVGDNAGWTFNVENWSNGKKFKPGDVLIFKYDRSLHNVAVVNAEGYKSCTASSTSKTYGSGLDRVKLSRGRNYFICSFPRHCSQGLKIAVDAF